MDLEGAHENDDCCQTCGSRLSSRRFVEHGVYLLRAFLIGGGMVLSTFLLTAAMQSAPPEPPPQAACPEQHVPSCPDAVVTAPPAPTTTERERPPRPIVMPRSVAGGAAMLAEMRSERIEGSARVASVDRVLQSADAAYRRGQFQKALWRYWQASQQVPKRVDGHFGVAVASFELYQDRRARVFLERALRVDPGHALSHLLLGYLDQLNGRRAQSRAHYDQYLALAPDGAFAEEVRQLLNHVD